MTADALILGVSEGDETVLDYLDSLSTPQLEALFEPMFKVTRPEKSLADKNNESKPKTRQTKLSAKSLGQEKISKLSPEKLAMLRELGI